MNGEKRTAALSSPYSDAPSEKGMYLRETKELVALLRELDAIGCQSLVHAIGDGALDQLLDALEEARRGVAKRHRLPLLVNHCMICRPDQVERMKKSWIIDFSISKFIAVIPFFNFFYFISHSKIFKCIFYFFFT